MATQVKTGLIANNAITDAKIANVALTGVTASSGDSSTSLATTAFVAGEINSLIDSAPGALNTLNELAAAMGDDANFSTTVTNNIATKLPLAGGALTGDLSTNSRVAIGQSSFTGGGVLLDLHSSGSSVGSQAAFYNDHNTSGFFVGIAGNSTGNPLLYNSPDTNIEFYTNSAIAMTITSSETIFAGNVGIGENSPDGELHVKGTGGGNGDVYVERTSGAKIHLQAQSANGKIGTSSNHNLGLNTNGSTRIDIDSGGDVKINTGRLGIGMDAAQALDIDRTSGLSLRFYNSGTFKAGLQAVSGSGQMIGTSAANDFAIRSQSNLLFSAGGNTERMRIDTSGRVLIGKTSTGLGNTGVEFESGQLKGTAVNQVVQYLNRTSSDGSILEFRKDNSTVGSIATEGGDMAIGNDDVGLQFINGGKVVRGFNMATNARADAAVNLGMSTTRFKDLYLSGGIFLGGTGSANELDDYEEGTFNAVIYAQYGTITADTSDDLCFYTKIGRIVIVQGRIAVSSVSSPSGQLYVGGFPFNLASAGETSHGMAVSVNIYNAASNFGGEVVGEMTTTGGARILIRGNGGTTSAVHTAAANIDSGSLIGFTATYPAT